MSHGAIRPAGAGYGARNVLPCKWFRVFLLRSMDSQPQIRIGTAGWSYKDWDGIFYPPEVQRKKVHPLEYMARFFDMVEINTSFYGHIKPELAKLWVRRVLSVNPNFIFTAKLHRSFTHSTLPVMEPTSAATIKPTDEDEILTRRGLDALASEGKLGALLIQFPVSFKNSSLNREYIELLSRQFIEYPRVVEVRHDTWDNRGNDRVFCAPEHSLLQHRPATDRSFARTHRTRHDLSGIRAAAWPQL